MSKLLFITVLLVAATSPANAMRVAAGTASRSLVQFTPARHLSSPNNRPENDPYAKERLEELLNETVDALQRSTEPAQVDNAIGHFFNTHRAQCIYRGSKMQDTDYLVEQLSERLQNYKGKKIRDYETELKDTVGSMGIAFAGTGAALSVFIAGAVSTIVFVPLTIKATILYAIQKFRDHRDPKFKMGRENAKTLHEIVAQVKAVKAQEWDYAKNVTKGKD